MLSEFPSFPVNPDLTTIENCRSNVKMHADIFILIVGARYGSVDTADGRSITNIEFLEAQSKGIPIYCLVSKSVLDFIKIWRANPSADYSSVVDTPRLFEFVSSFMDNGSVWVFPFGNAGDIEEVLKSQFATLALDALNLRAQLKRSGIPDSLRDVGGEALRIVIDKGLAWEYRFFSQLLTDEFTRLAMVGRTLELGLGSGGKTYLPPNEVGRWIQDRIAELKEIIAGATTILNEDLQEAFGPAGSPGDPEKISFCAKGLAAYYRKSLEWTAARRTVRVDAEYETLLIRLSGLGEHIAHDLASRPKLVGDNLAEALSRVARGETGIRMKITLVITAPDMTAWDNEFESLKARGLL